MLLCPLVKSRAIVFDRVPACQGLFSVWNPFVSASAQGGSQSWSLTDTLSASGILMDLIFCYKHFRTEGHRWGFLPMLRGSSRLLSEATPSPSEEACPPELCLAATPRLLVWNFLSTLPDSGAAGLLPLVRPSDLLWMAWQAVEVWPLLPP